MRRLGVALDFLGEQASLLGGGFDAPAQVLRARTHPTKERLEPRQRKRLLAREGIARVRRLLLDWIEMKASCRRQQLLVGSAVGGIARAPAERLFAVGLHEHDRGEGNALLGVPGAVGLDRAGAVWVGEHGERQAELLDQRGACPGGSTLIAASIAPAAFSSVFRCARLTSWPLQYGHQSPR